MRKLPSNQLDADSLFLTLSRRLDTVVKRGVAYTLNTYNGGLAVVSLFVVGKRGTIQLNISLVQRNDKWYASTPNETYELENIGEIVSLCKYLINRLYSTIRKI